MINAYDYSPDNSKYTCITYSQYLRGIKPVHMYNYIHHYRNKTL